jgi:hypothetical protein
MSFNENTFILVGTGIAMAGFGLYLWDTRVSKRVGNLASGFRGNSQQQQAQQYSPYDQRDSLDSRNSYSFGGKSKKNKASELHKKTKKRNK